MVAAKPLIQIFVNPTIDKLVAAYCYVVYVLETTLEGVEFIFQDETLPSRVVEGAFDVDALGDYKTKGWGGTTEVVAREFHLLDKPGVAALVAITGENNKNGCVKELLYSFARLVREWSEVKRDPQQVAADHDHRDWVLQETALFLDPFLRIIKEQVPERPGFEEAFPEIGKVGGKPDLDRPKLADLRQRVSDRRILSFTLYGHLRNWWDLGETPEFIRQEAEFWLDQWAEVEAWNQRGHEEAETAQPFHFQAQDKITCAFVDFDHSKAANFLFAERPALELLIVRNTAGGHVAILTRRRNLDLRLLFQALDQKERGRWHLETRFPTPMVLNGSTMRLKEPTSLSQDELMGLVQKYVKRT